MTLNLIFDDFPRLKVTAPELDWPISCSKIPGNCTSFFFAQLFHTNSLQTSFKMTTGCSSNWPIWRTRNLFVICLLNLFHTNSLKSSFKSSQEAALNSIHEYVKQNNQSLPFWDWLYSVTHGGIGNLYVSLLVTLSKHQFYSVTHKVTSSHTLLLSLPHQTQEHPTFWHTFLSVENARRDDPCE